MSRPIMVDAEIHSRIKALCLASGMKMQGWVDGVLRAALPATKRGRKPKAKQEANNASGD